MRAKPCRRNHIPTSFGQTLSKSMAVTIIQLFTPSASIVKSNLLIFNLFFFNINYLVIVMYMGNVTKKTFCLHMNEIVTDSLLFLL